MSAHKAEAFTSARGTPQQRLDEIADAAFAAHPRTLDACREFVLRNVVGQADLLWALFDRYQRQATDMLLAGAAARKREKSSGATTHTNTRDISPPTAGGPQSAGPTDEEKEAARGVVARVISKLDTFKINGRPIGDCTPTEASGWSDTKKREMRFIYLVTSGLPPNLPIRQFIRPDEAEAFWEQAQRDDANE